MTDKLITINTSIGKKLQKTLGFIGKKLKLCSRNNGKKLQTCLKKRDMHH